ncbi:MAG: hypothetical protein LBU14_00360 [Candidatus Peribacteria bacterium]|nr:hypothetical protein [Candidatus Peribacteria bacterium]
MVSNDEKPVIEQVYLTKEVKLTKSLKFPSESEKFLEETVKLLEIELKKGEYSQPNKITEENFLELKEEVFEKTLKFVSKLEYTPENVEILDLLAKILGVNKKEVSKKIHFIGYRNNVASAVRVFLLEIE